MWHYLDFLSKNNIISHLITLFIIFLINLFKNVYFFWQKKQNWKSSRVYVRTQGPPSEAHALIMPALPACQAYFPIKSPPKKYFLLIFVAIVCGPGGLIAFGRPPGPQTAKWALARGPARGLWLAGLVRPNGRVPPAGSRWEWGAPPPKPPSGPRPRSGPRPC